MKLELSRIYDAGLMDKIRLSRSRSGSSQRAQGRIGLYWEKWRKELMVIWILWALILAMLAWMGFNYLRIRRAAKIVDNEEFEALIRTGQLNWFARPSRIPQKTYPWSPQYSFKQLKTSLAALRKDKPVLLYENQRAQRVTNAALYLKNKAFLRFISFLMAWILGKGKSKLRNKKTRLGYFRAHFLTAFSEKFTNACQLFWLRGR